MTFGRPRQLVARPSLPHRHSPPSTRPTTFADYTFGAHEHPFLLLTEAEIKATRLNELLRQIGKLDPDLLQSVRDTVQRLVLLRPKEATVDRLRVIVSGFLGLGDTTSLLTNAQAVWGTERLSGWVWHGTEGAPIGFALVHFMNAHRDLAEAVAEHVGQLVLCSQGHWEAALLTLIDKDRRRRDNTMLLGWLTPALRFSSYSKDGSFIEGEVRIHNVTQEEAEALSVAAVLEAMGSLRPQVYALRYKDWQAKIDSKPEIAALAARMSNEFAVAMVRDV